MIFKNRKNKKRILNEIKDTINLIDFKANIQTKEKNEAKVFRKSKVYGDSKMFNNNVAFCYKSMYNHAKVYDCSKWDI